MPKLSGNLPKHELNIGQTSEAKRGGGRSKISNTSDSDASPLRHHIERVVEPSHDADIRHYDLPEPESAHDRLFQGKSQISKNDLERFLHTESEREIIAEKVLGIGAGNSDSEKVTDEIEKMVQEIKCVMKLGLIF